MIVKSHISKQEKLINNLSTEKKSKKKKINVSAAKLVAYIGKIENVTSRERAIRWTRWEEATTRACAVRQSTVSNMAAASVMPSKVREK